MVKYLALLGVLAGCACTKPAELAESTVKQCEQAGAMMAVISTCINLDNCTVTTTDLSNLLTVTHFAEIHCGYIPESAPPVIKPRWGAPQPGHPKNADA